MTEMIWQNLYAKIFKTVEVLKKNAINLFSFPTQIRHRMAAIESFPVKPRLLHVKLIYMYLKLDMAVSYILSKMDISVQWKQLNY